MSYEEESRKLADYCRKCGGRCCIGDSITISENEMKRLKEEYDFETGVRETPCGKINTIKNLEDPSKKTPCFFLIENSCMLKGRARPLSCRLFPLTFLMEDNKPKFFLSDFCPYVKEVSQLKEWINEAIRQAEEDLDSWTEEEKMARSFLHEKIHENRKHLIDI